MSNEEVPNVEWLGVPEEHRCILPTVFPWPWKKRNPPLKTVVRCMGCGKCYQYDYSYPCDDAPCWNLYTGDLCE